MSTPLATIRANSTVDLHMHTTVSDGRWTPETLVARIASLGIRVMAVADHDALDSVAPTRRLAATRGIALVSGVEVTTRWDGRQWHLLVYGAEGEGGPLRELVDRQRQRHIDAATEAIARLERAGYALPSLDAAVAGRPPLPIYVMDALIRDDHAPNILAANRLVTETLGVPFYIDVPLGETVAAAHAAGGVAILAHPGRDEGAGILTPERLERMLRAVTLDGLEVHYPTHTLDQMREYAALADQYGLLRSCGSDSHGPGRPRDPLPYHASLVSPLLERLGFHFVSASD
ncbi:MAG TPA: PHP domain-containing protein [Thermomicrobiales bacterium]|jgi:predicted metal-dependent phosphoesterase TrpH